MDTHYDTAPESPPVEDISLSDVVQTLTNNVSLIIFLTVLGGVVRWLLVRGAFFPAGDGGWLYGLVAALEGAPFQRLPFFTYNGWDVPFAQPPLVPISLSLLSTGTERPLWDVMQLTALAVSIVQIPVFYLLARKMLGVKVAAVTATLVFALSPSILTTTLNTSGLSIGIGMLWVCITVWAAFQLMARPSELGLLLTAVGLTLTLLTHGESGAFVVASIVLIALVFGRGRVVWLYLLLVIILTLMALMIWLGPVLSLHGVRPYLGAWRNADLFGLSVQEFFVPQRLFTGEAILPIFTVMGVLGAAIALAKRQVFLPIWLGLSLVILGDQTRVLAMIPLALLVGVALHQLVLPILHYIGRAFIGDGVLFIEYYSPRAWLVQLNRQLFRIPLLLFVVFIAIYGGWGAIVQASQSLEAARLSDGDRVMMTWVVNNLPAEAVVAVMTRDRTALETSWFPAWTNLQSVTTFSGIGWTGRDSSDVTERYVSCFDSDVACLDAALAEVGGPQVTHVVFPTGERGILLGALELDPSFTLIYEEDDTLIFERVQAAASTP